MPTANIELGIDGQTLALSVEVPREPVKASTLLPLAHALSNRLTEIAVANQAEAVSCTKGCGACCRQLVPVSTTEARAIAELIAALPESKQATVRKRFDETLVQLANAGQLERLRDLSALRKEELLPVGLDYLRLGIACPFLEDESCSIHAQRPVICREYLVSSPATACADPAPNRVRRIALGARVSRALPALEPTQNAPVMPWLPLVLTLEWQAKQGDEPLRPGTDLLRALFGSLTGSDVPAPPALGTAA